MSVYGVVYITPGDHFSSWSGMLFYCCSGFGVGKAMVTLMLFDPSFGNWSAFLFPLMLQYAGIDWINLNIKLQ
jgi:hypothetical protein